MDRFAVSGFVSRAIRFHSRALAALGCAAIFFGFAEYHLAGSLIAAEVPRKAQPIPSPPPWVRRVYDANCSVCHGVEGDGNGPAASTFITRPRDFRSGIFKFRSTPSGSLPADEDLDRTITYGLRWTGMIARPDLAEAERNAVVQYIKLFSSRFITEKPLPRIQVAPRPNKTADFVAQGEILFRDADCASCHGARGRGDGPSAADMKDDWGWPIRPGDITWRPLKRGSGLEQIYLSIATGISGTPMPAFGDALEPRQIWSIVYYLESLVPAERRLGAQQVLGEEQQGRMALHMGGMMGMGRGRLR